MVDGDDKIHEKSRYKTEPDDRRGKDVQQGSIGQVPENAFYENLMVSLNLLFEINPFAADLIKEFLLFFLDFLVKFLLEFFYLLYKVLEIVPHKSPD